MLQGVYGQHKLGLVYFSFIFYFIILILGEGGKAQVWEDGLGKMGNEYDQGLLH